MDIMGMYGNVWKCMGMYYVFCEESTVRAAFDQFK